MIPKEEPKCFWRMLLAVLLALFLREVFAMAHGARTWSNVGADEVVFGLDDHAELAARLGSPVTHNREGNIVFIETFEHGMAPWTVATSGTGAEVRCSAESYRSSGYSAKMICGSDELKSAQFDRRFPYPVLGRYGLEWSVHFANEVVYLIVTLEYRDGTTAHQFQLTYEPAAEEMRVTLPGGSSTAVVEDLALSVGYDLFHTIKLVADFENDLYHRLIINETETEIDAYDAYTFAAAGNPYVTVIFTVYGHTDLNDSLYIDDIILTQNEPP